MDLDVKYIIFIVLLIIGTFNIVLSIQLFQMYRDLYERYLKLKEVVKCKEQLRRRPSDTQDTCSVD